VTRPDPDAELSHDLIWSCPGCWSWQLHVTELVRMGWSRKEFDAMIEEIIRAHVAHDCPAPRLVHELWKNRGRP
jgi:hypothetical protein